MYAYWIPVKMSWFKMFSHLRSQANLVPKLSNVINLLTPNVNYSGRTTPLTSKVAFFIFIQQI